MPIDISVHTDPDYNLCRWSGEVSVADIDHLIAQMEAGLLHAEFDLLHDMRAATSMALPGNDAAKLGFRRRATFDDDAPKQVRAAMVGASPQIEEVLKLWRAMFFGDEPRYIMRSFAEMDDALTWLDG